ncbi:hypothetical protein N308_10348, partial [Struthio camelus australis]
HMLSTQDLCLELCTLDLGFVSPPTALLQLCQAVQARSSAGGDGHGAGPGRVSTSPRQSRTVPKINATEGINRREKKPRTLGRQDCFVFPKAMSLLTRRLLF